MAPKKSCSAPKGRAAAPQHDSTHAAIGSRAAAASCRKRKRSINQKKPAPRQCQARAAPPPTVPAPTSPVYPNEVFLQIIPNIIIVLVKLMGHLGFLPEPAAPASCSNTAGSICFQTSALWLPQSARGSRRAQSPSRSSTSSEDEAPRSGQAYRRQSGKRRKKDGGSRRREASCEGSSGGDISGLGTACKPSPGSLHELSEGLWKHLIVQGVLNSIPPSTHRSYEQAVAAFMAFASSVGGTGSWPVSEDLVLQYLASLRERGITPKTMACHLDAISFYSQAFGHPDPCQFFARKAIKGWKRLDKGLNL